jgi:hypothetical protein
MGKPAKTTEKVWFSLTSEPFRLYTYWFPAFAGMTLLYALPKGFAIPKTPFLAKH